MGILEVVLKEELGRIRHGRRASSHLCDSPKLLMAHDYLGFKAATSFPGTL
jgi:hypothetical protein